MRPLQWKHAYPLVPRAFTGPTFYTDIQFSQIPTTVFPQCPTLQSNFEFGARDAETRGQVSALQRYLAEYYRQPFSELVTGYFGTRTRDNVRRFQCDTFSLCSGDESSGYGAVGPRTRAAIESRCRMGGVNTSTDRSLESSTSGTAEDEVPNPRIPSSTVTNDTGGNTTPNSDDDFSCTHNGVTVRDSSSAPFYSAQSDDYPNTCTNIIQTRTYTAGDLFGSSQYQYASCAVNGAPPRTDGGASSSVTDNTLMRYYEATPSGASASTQTPTLDRTGSVVTCSYNGTMYMEGRSIWVSQSCRTLETSSTSCGYYMTCGRGGWVNGSSAVGNGSVSCTFENTPEGSLCGGQYHCGFGVNGHTWSTAACTLNIR